MVWRWINGGRGKRDNKPHGCVWMKNATRSEEEEAVKVVENGVGGTKRVWKPATKCGQAEGLIAPRRSQTGKWIPRVGAPKGRQTSREVVLGNRTVSRTGR